MAAVPLLEPQKLEPPPPLPPPVRQWYAETGTPTQPWFTELDLVRYTVDKSMLSMASAERSSHQKTERHAPPRRRRRPRTSAEPVLPRDAVHVAGARHCKGCVSRRTRKHVFKKCAATHASTSLGCPWSWSGT